MRKRGRRGPMQMFLARKKERSAYAVSSREGRELHSSPGKRGDSPSRRKGIVARRTLPGFTREKREGDASTARKVKSRRPPRGRREGTGAESASREKGEEAEHLATLSPEPCPCQLEERTCNKKGAQAKKFESLSEREKGAIPA